MAIWLLLFTLALEAAAWGQEPPASIGDAPPQGPTMETAPQPGPVESTDTSRTRQRLRELDRRLSTLESVVVGRGQGRGVIERGLGWSPARQERGFALYSNDGLFRLHLNGGVQTDYHASPRGRAGSDPGAESDGFVIRRLRPILDFRIGRDFRGQIMPDFAPRRRSELFNAFVDWDRYEQARVRVGQFKPVMSIENQQGEFDLVFAERSLVQNFALRRTFGVQVSGRAFDHEVRYDVGVFNSDAGAIGSGSFPEPSSDSNKLGMARVMYTPFLNEGPKALRKLDAGIGVLQGACRESVCQQPMLSMGQERILFQYHDTVKGNGFHTWVLPQMSWFYKRAGVMSTFVHTWEPKIDRATGKSTQLQHEAWMVQGEFALTDDEPAFTRIVPKNPFDLDKAGHWGAWTIAARYSEQRLDPDAFNLNFGDATRFVRTTKAFSVALNWYASREFRFQNIWEHSDFKGANGSYAATGKSDFLIFRATLIY